MSFTLKMASRTLPNGDVIPSVEKTFESGVQLDEWHEKHTNYVTTMMKKMASRKKLKRKTKKGK